jgi:hypothetical protein
MKKIYAIALSFLPFLGFGQFDVEWHTPDLKEGHPGEDVGFDYTLTNTNANDSISISWKFTHELDSTLGVWEDYMCEGIFVCWPAFKRSNDFKLGPNEEIDMYHHILTLNTHDTGMYVSTAYIWQSDDSANTVQEMVVTAHIVVPDSIFTTIGGVQVVIVGGDSFELNAGNWVPLGLTDLSSAKPFLGQNAPNPCRQQTRIAYELSSEQGIMTFQDLTGKLVMEVPLLQRAGTLTLNGQLEAGIYFYSLWENGALVDSKRMQVIE